MYCPLKFNEETLDAVGDLPTRACQCEKEGCEWWIEDKGCAIRILVEVFSLKEESELKRT